MGPVDFSATPVDASLEFGDGQRPGLRSEFVLPLDLSPYAAPAWIAEHGKAVDANTPRSALIHHQTLPGAWDEWFAREGIVGEAGREGPRYDIMSMALNASLAGMGVAAAALHERRVGGVGAPAAAVAPQWRYARATTSCIRKSRRRCSRCRSSGNGCWRR